MTVVMCQRVSHSCDIGCIYVLRTIFIHNINVKNQQIFWCNRNVWKYPDQADACICHEFVKRKRKAEARSIETQPLNVNQWNIINSWLFWVWCVLFSSKWYDTCYRALALTVPRIGGSVFNENCQMFKGNRFLCNSQFNNFPVNLNMMIEIEHRHTYSLKFVATILWYIHLSLTPFLVRCVRERKSKRVWYRFLSIGLSRSVLEIKIRVLSLHDTRLSITSVHVRIFQSKWMVASLSANFMECEYHGVKLLIPLFFLKKINTVICRHHFNSFNNFRQIFFFLSTSKISN